MKQAQIRGEFSICDCGEFKIVSDHSGASSVAVTTEIYICTTDIMHPRGDVFAASQMKYIHPQIAFQYLCVCASDDLLCASQRCQARL